MSNDIEREQWGSRTGFIMAAIGSAVGLGNIWRFPSTAYENGGGAFMLPYLVALLTAGIPILILEFSLGQKLRSTVPGAFGKINKKFQFFGWIQVLIAFVISTYYAVIIAWSLSFMFFSFKLKWGDNPEAFLFGDYLRLTDGPMNIGSLNMQVFIPLLIVIGINYTILSFGIKRGLEKANEIFMPLLVISLLIIVVRGVTLPGALDGLDHFFAPNFEKLTDTKVWLAAYGQIFFSLSICFSIMYAYSSYLPKDSDITNNAFMTGLGNCTFSLIAGIGVFSVLGFMAANHGKDISEVVSGGVGLAFVVFPTAISEIPGIWGPITGVVFFGSLLFAGFSSSLSIMEAVVSSVADKFGMGRQKTLTIITLLILSLATFIAFDGGLFLLDIIDYYSNQFGIIIAGVIELILFGFLFNLRSIREYANRVSDFTIGVWWEYAIRFTAVILIVLLARLIIENLNTNYEGYSNAAILIYGVGTLVFIGVFALVMTKIKGSPEFEEALDAGSPFKN